MFISKILHRFIEAWHRHRWQNFNINQLNDHELRDLGLDPDGWPQDYHSCCC